MKQWVNTRTHNIKGYLIRPRLIALAYALAAFIILLVLWLYIGALAKDRLMLEERIQVASRVNTIGTSLTLAVNQRLALITSVHSFIQAEIYEDNGLNLGSIDETNLVNNFVSGLYASTAGIRNIAIAPDGVMQYVYPYERNKNVIGYNPALDERPFVKEDVQRAIQTGEIVLSLPLTLIQGGQGLIARQAIYVNGRYWGLANVVLDLPPLLDEAALNPMPEGLDLAILDQAGKVFFGSEQVFSGQPVTYEVILPEGNWILAARPDTGWGVQFQSILWIYHGLGLIVIVTLPLVIYLFINRRECMADLIDRRTQELALANQTLINVLEGIDADVYVADLDTFEVLFANKHIRDSFKNELVGKICYEVFRNEKSVCGHCKNELLLDSNGQPTGVHVWEIQNPITRSWYKNADRAIRWQDGRYVHLQIATDISEQKNAAMALQESVKRYQAVVENQTEFIVRWKPDGTRSFVNEAYLRYYNLTLEQALASPFIPLIAEEDRAAVEDKMQRLITGAVSSETDTHRVIRPDGTIGWQEWTDRAILDEDGKIVEFQSVGRDITERKLADEALRLKTEELEALFSISSHLRAAQSADAMLPVVVAEMRRVLHSDANAVIMLDPDNEHFNYALGDGPLAVNYGLQFDVAQSISGLVMQTRQPYVTDDLSSDPHKTTALKGDSGLGPAILAPVVSESEFLGVLLCARNKGGASQPYSSSEIRLLTAIGEMVGNALRRARLFDQALKRLQHLQTLHSIDTAISANMDLKVILDVLLTQGVAQLDVDAACVLLLNPHTHILEYTAGKGFRSKEIKLARLRLGEGLPGKAVLERKVISIPNLLHYEGDDRKYLLKEGFAFYQAAPLIAKGQLQGVLETFNRSIRPVIDEQTGFLETLATQAAIAIDNSQLFSDLQRSNFELEMAYDATIEGWSRALELRDFETEGHTLRVADMTMQLAQSFGVRNSDLIHIRRGALLHDIGKMGVPDRILLKPGKLTVEEWEIMKRHTEYAFEMLWPIEFLRPAIDIPHYHHERWDGSGYPRQLKGDQIPLSARLFAVVDVWDALTSDRSYRTAWAEIEVLDYITANAGKHFDPRVVELFLILQKKNSNKLLE